MIYTVQGKKFTHRRHVNQLQKRITNELTETPQIEEDDLQDLYDTFDHQMPQAEQEAKVKRKRKAPPQLIINPKRKKILKIHKEEKAGQKYWRTILGGGYHLPFRHNEPVPSAVYIAVVYKTSKSDEVSLSLSTSESSLEGE